MAIRDHAGRSYQIKFVRCYLAPRLASGAYSPWVDISRHVSDSAIGTYERSIDTDDFDIGFYEESNVSLELDNSEGLFNAGEGYFENAVVDRSKIRIDAGFEDVETGEPDFEIAFEGIIDDRGTSINLNEESVQYTILAYSSIINRLRADSTVVSNGQTFKNALYNLLNRSDITQLLTLSLDNINPQVNQTIDDATWFVSKQLSEAINKLLLAANSVLKIKDNTLYIVPRRESSTVRYQFFGKGSPRPCNIESMEDFNNGLRRTITSVQVNATIRDAEDELVDLYGARTKKIDLGFINNPDKETAICNDILDEFQYPKTELTLTTDYLGLEIDLLDMVTIDNEGFIIDDEPALYGKAVYGESTYVRRHGGVKIRNIEGFKVLSVSHNYQRYSTTYKLRGIGNRPFDTNAGYTNPLYGQAVYGVSRYAEV